MTSKLNLGPWIDGLEVLAPIAKAVPILGASVEGSLEALKQILQYTEKVKSNKEDSIALAKYASEITPTLFAALQTRNDLDSMTPNIERLVKILVDIAAFAKERSERSKLKRLRTKQSDADDIKKWEKELHRAFERFNVHALLDIDTRAANMQSGVTDLQAQHGALQAREEKKSEHELLSHLAPVKTAFHDHADAAPPCLAGTRVLLLNDIENWMANPSDKTTFWLTGVAGTGKTTVAQSVAGTASKLNLLVATFFFSHTSEDCRDYRKVIPTLAYQLARDARLRPGILAAIDADKDLTAASTSIQGRKLLFDVPRTVNSQPPYLLIVLDALDECSKDRNRMISGDLIPILLTGLKDIPFVKIFITSRPEPSIEAMFADKPLDGATQTLALHRDIEKMTVQSDIAHYINSELTKLRTRIPNNHTFPAEADIHTLVERADSLFIYARTAVEYISDPYGKPDRRLAALIQAKPENSKGQFSSLDKIYSQILGNAHGPSSHASVVNDDLRSTLVALVVAQQPLPVDDLAAIGGIDVDECRECMRHISALLNYRHETDEPIRLMHLSFPDFLLDIRRCSEFPGYVVDVSQDHLRITEYCLKLMNTHLRYDICNIQDPSLFNTEVLDFAARLDKYLPVFLRYSCRFWMTHWLYHIRAAGPRSKAPQGLDQFCMDHLLHWIEVLSLTADLYAAQQVMPELMSFMNSHPDWKGLDFRSSIADAHFLMRDYQIPIGLSALQVYHSGMVTMPECELRKTAQDVSIAQLISERDQGWQIGSTILEGHTDSVVSVAFSSDSLRIVSGSSDYTLRTWDAISGAIQHTLEGHTSSLTSVAFSSDGSQIVSGSNDATVRTWDAVLGTMRHTFEGHSAQVTSVDFSSDGSRIVSGSGDHTVRTWDAISGVLQNTLEGHTSFVLSVAFSSDSSRIVSGSHDCTVRIWDVISGILQHTLEGHTRTVYSVAFSSDGSQIVSGSSDATVRIWDAISGVLQHILEGHTSFVLSVAFSSNGLHIVSGSDDRNVLVWDAVSGILKHTLEGHTQRVLSVAFSSDSSQIVSGSWDRTVRIWDAVSDILQHGREGHTDRVYSVAFSFNGLRLVSGSGDCTVCIWDAVSGMLQHKLQGHADRVLSVAFSSDGLHVVSGSADFTMRIWDANTGATQHILDKFDIFDDVQPFLAKSPLCEEIRIEKHDSSTTFKLDEGDQGWLFRCELDGTWQRMCWLPHKRRGYGRIAFSRQRVAIGAASGLVTILDFSNI